MSNKLIYATEDYNSGLNMVGSLVYTGSNYIYSGTIDTVTQVKNALGESSTSVGVLCSSSKINKWAAFKSGKWGYNTNFETGVFEWVASTDGFRLGDFIGYNHNAKPPVYYVDALPTTLSVERWTNSSILVKLARGEMQPVVKTYSGICSKNQIDIQSIVGTGVSAIITHQRISVPVTGSYSYAVPVLTDYNTTVTIKPTYYVDMTHGDYEDYSVIEDGARTVNVVVTPVAVTGSMFGIPENQTGGNPIEASILWGLTRTVASAKNIYLRVYPVGTGIALNYSDIVYVQLTASGSANGSLPLTILSNTGASTSVQIRMEISDTYDFTNKMIVVTKSFTWTNPAGVQ